jgi:signal transduction histidine kinase
MDLSLQGSRTCRTRFNRRRITLETRLAAAETALIKGDADRLAQVFINILDSAGKLIVDAAPREVSLAGESVDLTPTRFDLLWYLVG